MGGGLGHLVGDSGGSSTASNGGRTIFDLFSPEVKVRRDVPGYEDALIVNMDIGEHILEGVRADVTRLPIRSHSVNEIFVTNPYNMPLYYASQTNAEAIVIVKVVAEDETYISGSGVQSIVYGSTEYQEQFADMLELLGGNS